jgi:hypothetical protein
MYSLVKVKNEDFNIVVGDFVVGEGYRDKEGYWCAVVKNEKGLVGLKYCSKNRKSAVEGLIKQMIYRSYNSVLDEV